MRTRGGIKRRVNFNGVKVFGVEGQAIFRFHAFGIETTSPAWGGERAGTEIDLIRPE
jgi:hypothetical protein